MKKILKWLGIGFLAFLACMVLVAFLGKEKTENIVIQPVDLAQVPDGTYVGQYNGYRFTNVAEVTVENHAITAINVLKTQRDDLSRDLAREVILAQSPRIDATSGATLDQNAFLKAVELALTEASETK